MSNYILVGFKLHKSGHWVGRVLRQWRLVPKKDYLEGEIDYYVNRQGYEYENLHLYQKVFY